MIKVEHTSLYGKVAERSKACDSSESLPAVSSIVYVPSGSNFIVNYAVSSVRFTIVSDAESFA